MTSDVAARLPASDPEEPVAPDPPGRAPRLSVVVPARRCAHQLRTTLPRLRESTHRDFELLVVDDASGDDTAEVARAHGARVVTLGERGGPAAARNRGAQEARGEIVFFVDADCAVHPHTLAHVVAAFDADPGIDALFGSYDTTPAEPALVSQYRNLLHHFVHQQGKEEASTFWSGCGAIRRQVFLEHGGFDPSLYDRPAIEDIELGARLVRAGHRIVVAKHVQVTHLKRWTLAGVIRTDLFDRGIPWMRLILREGHAPDDLNTSWAQRVSLLLVAALLAFFAIEALRQPWLLVVPVATTVWILGADWITRRGPAPWWLAVLGLVAGWEALVLGGVLAPRWTGWTLLGLSVLVALNRRLYTFYMRERGLPFAFCVLPLHVLYYAYSGLALALGLAGHAWERWGPSGTAWVAPDESEAGTG